MQQTSLVAMRSGLALGALLAAGTASAISITMVPSQRTFDVNASSHTLTVDFVLGGGATNSDNVLRAFDFLVAYNRDVLTYQSTTFYGYAFGGSGAMPPGVAGLIYAGPPDSAAVNYLTSPAPNGGTVLNPSALGNYMGPAPLYNDDDYYEGSLDFKMAAAQGAGGISTADLILAQSGTNIKLFTVTFNVTVDQIAASSIVMLDDKSWTNATSEVFDAKDGDGDIIYLSLPGANANQIDVPLPGTLALLGAGLVGFGRRLRGR